MGQDQLWNTFITSLVSGGLTGCILDLILFPIDAFKTRLQSSLQGKEANWKNPYAGLGASLLASFPAAATFWATYLTTKTYLQIYGIQGPSAHLISAILGSIATSFIRNPFELIKILLQSSRFDTTYQALQYILTTSGYPGLWTGLISLIMREIPFDALQFLIFEWLITGPNGGILNDFGLRQPVCGAIAGGLAAFFTTPIDVAKTRMMVYAGTGKYSNVYSTLLQIWKQQGFMVLMQSWKTRVFYTTVGGTIFFGCFDFLRDILIRTF